MKYDDATYQWQNNSLVPQLVASVLKLAEDKLDQSYQIIYDLLEAIPKQTNDADWWPDELTRSVDAATKFLEQNDPECKLKNPKP